MSASAAAASHAAPSLMLMPSVTVAVTLLASMLLAYLIGSIPFGLLLGRASGEGDIRTIGSGNIGATNMLRTGRKELAAATLALDMAKGAFAVLLGGWLVDYAFHSNLFSGASLGLERGTPASFYGLYAVIGHVWPVWLKFKGGKGVATALGALLAFAPLVGIFCCALWVVTCFVTRYSSMSSLTAMAVAPLLCFATHSTGAGVASLLISAIVYYRHRENISRLLAGTESKVSFGKRANG